MQGGLVIFDQSRNVWDVVGATSDDCVNLKQRKGAT